MAGVDEIANAKDGSAWPPNCPTCSYNSTITTTGEAGAFSSEDVHRLIKLKDIERVSSSLFVQFVKKSEAEREAKERAGEEGPLRSFFMCPRGDVKCGAVIEYTCDTRYECPGCHIQMCIPCKAKYHFGETCTEFSPTKAHKLTMKVSVL